MFSNKGLEKAIEEMDKDPKGNGVINFDSKSFWTRFNVDGFFKIIRYCRGCGGEWKKCNCKK